MVLVSDTAYILLRQPCRTGVLYFRWADVPVTEHTDIFVSASGCSHGSPTVKYRGLFLNDEAPALTNWAAEKFTNGTGAALTGSPFNHFFYTHLYVAHVLSAICTVIGLYRIS